MDNVGIIAKTRARKKSQNISATRAANIPITCVAPSLMVDALAINVPWASTDRRFIVGTSNHAKNERVKQP